MEIYILRHGKAEERALGITSDAKRRLTEAGRAEMEEEASGMASLGMRVDYIISSPLERARETAEIVAGRLQKRAPRLGVTIWAELKPESDILDTHRRLVGMEPDAGIMLVGHEPHLSSLASSIVLARNGSFMNLKKGGLVTIRANAAGREVHGHLRSLMTPRHLRMCGRAARCN